MDFDVAERFMRQNHHGVVTTFRRSGASQISLVSSGPFRGGVTFVALGNSVKEANLKRDPRCVVLTATSDWHSYVVVEGTAEVHAWDNTDHEELRLLLRESFKACGGEHSDYDEYDRVMKEQGRIVVVVRPGNVYGRLR